MKITKYFIERSKLTNLLIFFIILVGLISIYTLPRQDMPNVDFNIVSIITYYPGASPTDVEINVTDLIEDELEKIDGIDELSSFSIEGMSCIYVMIDPDSNNIVQVKDDIRSSVDRVTGFPEQVDSKPIIREMKSTDFPILEVAVMSNTQDEDILRRIARDLESEFKSIGKVGVVEKIAYRKKEVQILTDIKKMEKSYVSFIEIINAIKARNIKLTGGTLESFTDEKKIMTMSEFEELTDVKDVIIRSNFSGNHIRVSDIAEVKVGHKKRQRISRTNSINSINLIVKRRGTTDVIDLSKQIDEVVEKYQKKFVDKGIEIKKVVDYSYYTKSLLRIVKNNAFIGFCLVVIALFIFLNFHTAFWVAIGIPLSIFGAYIFFPVFDITTNQVTLITIIMVLGMLVDDAIVVAENIGRHKEEGMEPRKAAIFGTQEVFQPVFATIITTILCFIPIYFMKGIIGKFIVSIPTIVILTLCFSLFESITLLPVHLGNWKINLKRKKKLDLLSRLKTKYEKILRTVLKFRKITIFLLFSGAIFTANFFYKVSKFELFPTDNFDLFYIVMETPLGYSLEETLNKVKEVEKAVHKIPSDLMVSYKTIVGDHKTDEAASNPSLHENWALITVVLHPASKRNKRSEKIIEELKRDTKDIKGLVKFNIREMQDGPPVGKPIQVRLVSDNFNFCIKYEKKLLNFIKNIKGVKDIETSNRPGKKEIRLELDHSYMAKVGITAMDLANTVRMAYSGDVATTIRKNGEEIDFRVKLNDKQRYKLDVLKELQILNQKNNLIKIKKFVKFKKGSTEQTISHYDGKKAIKITAEVDNTITTASEANQLIKNEFSEEIAGIPGLSIVFGGQEKETMKSMRNFIMAFACAVIGMYAILVILLNSFFAPFLIMIAIPFGIIGVLVAFYVHGLSLSFMGLIGTLGMIGVVVNDSLVMVTHLNSLRKQHHQMNSKILIEGAKTRLRPVLLTTITTVLGLLPTVYGWGGSEPFIVPMVLAMSWGLAFATLVTLIIIPILYSLTVKNFNHLDH